MSDVHSLESYLKYFNHIHVIFYKNFEDKDSKKYEQQLDTLEINLLNGQLTIGNNGNQQKTISTNVLKILTKIP